MPSLRIAFIGLLVVSLTSARAAAQDVLQFDTDLNRAAQTAAQTNRLLLLHFWGTWCPPCMKMEQEVFAKPGLGTALSPYFVAAKVQVEQGKNEDVAQRFGVDGFPCDIVINAQGQIVHKSKGFHTAEQYVSMLQQVAQTSLTQARPIAAGAPAAAAPVATPTPAAPATPAAAPRPTAAAAPQPEDRYAYYYKDRQPPPGAAAAAGTSMPAPAAVATPTPTPTPVSTQTPTPVAPTAVAAASTPPPTTATPSAPPVAAAPAKPIVGDRYADYRSSTPSTSAAAPAPTPTPITTPIPTPVPVAAGPAPAAPVAPPVAVAAAPVATPTPVATPAPVAAPTPVAPAPAVAAAPVPVAAPAPAAPAAPVTPPSIAVNPAIVPPAPAPATPPKVEPTVAAATPAASAAVNATQTSTAAKPSAAAIQLPPGCPPLALDGYCPVTVTDKMVWKKGDVRYGAIHKSRTYLFGSVDDQKKFLAEPDKYSPIISGNDPVVALEKGETVPGKREYGLMCQNRMFLFSSKESYDKFCGDSKRYAGEIFTAMQAAEVKRR